MGRMIEHNGNMRGYIAMVVVDPALRGRGIGRELVLKSIGKMKESGCDEVSWGW